ncbi:sensor histidine kinase [Micromonospora yangpuensis]|uniref:histidine kinase n=1 Tax=Micromonospora yangpuensis TaxID=683228 RepID=A0A1C6U629_9ACTN|nr:sensor histidine kinase [Micromonospora yangpuensis]GGL91490.1 histidine kinase [Micromonospora yangpuensis]SCL49371.1 Signal transduction histidine kinase [Micromonospora yangpuensis]
MSKRPKTAGSFRSRLRPTGRLRDMPIWSKLGLIMIVPTIATVVVGTSGLVDHLDTLNTANRAGDLANLTGYSGDLVNSLQDERTSAVLLLGAANGPTKERYREAYGQVNQRVDDAKGPYSQQRSEVDDLPNSLDVLLNRIDENLTELPGTRSQVFNGRLKLTDAVRTYEVLIKDLLDIRDSAAQLAGDNDLGERMRAAAATAQSKEWLSKRRVVVHRALIQQTLNPALREDYIATGTGQDQFLESFFTVANEAEEQFYTATVAGPDLREADNYNGWIKSNTTESMADAPFGPDQWDGAMTANAKLMRTVETKLDGDVVRQADAIRSDVQRQVFLETGLLLSMLLLAILFAYLVARSMARSLRELRQGALNIAQYGLPHAVARLRDPQLTGQLSPVQLANQIAEPLPVRSKDEFGQVTEAFNAVHLEAVRTAAEQAALRASVATMFVNLARRSQILVDRLIGHLDRLERGEEDPDRLAELFQLDHLATRMRRNDENLLVLAGADSTRVQREPAALIDVLRAAQSEVEHYTRIEFGVIDRDIEVAAHAVNDLVHLVAELFDNATAFSPPDSQVMVEARRVGERASLYVEDRGIGISVDQLADLNERLATPPQVDVAVSRMMGLVVVARLASRHGVKVELRPGTDRGTVADVTMPTSVLVPRALSGRQQMPALPASAGGLLPAGPQSSSPQSSGPQSSGPAPAFGGSSTSSFAGFGAAPALGSAPTGQIPAQRTGGSGNQMTLGGRSVDPAPRNGTPVTAGPGRALPAWSDLTGATGTNGDDSFGAPRTANGQQIDPLPQRRAGGDGDPIGSGQQPAIPRQPTSYAPPVSSPPVSGAPISGVPVSGQPISGAPVSGQPVSGSPVSGQPAYPGTGQSDSGGFAAFGGTGSGLPSRPAPNAPAPPVWPPVPGTEREAATPPVPERLAAALDMTTELPRVPRTDPEQRPAAQDTARQPAPAPARPTQQNRKPYADETMELPIFRELESAWFRTRRPGSDETTGAEAPQPVPVSAAATQQIPVVDANGRPVQRTATGTGDTPMADTPRSTGSPGDDGPDQRGGVADAFGSRRAGQPPYQGWQTAADDGWRAATAASEVPVAATTQTGLPKRTPMAQLVPGAVEKPTTSVQRRTPEAVRGLLSAYHRGVQRGRTNPSDGNPTNPGETPGGQQSSQSGSGSAAGSGQKEQQG